MLLVKNLLFSKLDCQKFLMYFPFPTKSSAAREMPDGIEAELDAFLASLRALRASDVDLEGVARTLAAVALLAAPGESAVNSLPPSEEGTPYTRRGDTLQGVRTFAWKPRSEFGFDYVLCAMNI